MDAVGPVPGAIAASGFALAGPSKGDEVGHYLDHQRTCRWLLPVLAAVLGTALGCSGPNKSPAAPDTQTGTGGTNPGGAGAPGTLTVRLTDSPFSDARALLVTFSEVSAHLSGTGWQTLPIPGGTRTCDLKQLQGAVDVLGVGSLPAGHYTQIRLNVVSAAIFLDNPAASGPCASVIATPAGDSAPVEVPSGEVKLNREFTVPAGGASTIVLDFDGDRSITQTGSSGAGNGRGRGNGGPNASRYIMHPVIAVVSVQ